MTTYESHLRQFMEAVRNLEAILQEKKNKIVRDAAIKRFEIAFDLAWKTVKAWAQDRGLSCTSPLACFREAFRQELLDEEEIWMELVRMRNETVHTYNEAMAEHVYGMLPQALIAFQKLAERLKGERP